MGKFRSRPRSAPDLAVAIRDAREQQGISQSDLAERIGAHGRGLVNSKTEKRSVLAWVEYFKCSTR
ncbi:helix-turn-helix domain-containing protein [Arcanobacterium ihumii]|uniref:helix-turn-helix domain-containing protein n=1 Tax=Arcanobacterium ihumii TaxID=2138162 RepID=UPI000F530ED5